MSVIFEVEFGKLTDYCDKAALLAGDVSNIMSDVTWLWGSRVVAQHFDSQADWAGDPWLPLSDWGWKMRRRNKDRNNYKILMDTGLLRNSLTTGAYQRSAVALVGKNKVEYGTPVKYAKKHELGEGLPKRSFMPGGSAEGLKWQQAMSDAITAKLEEYGIDN